MSAIEALKTDIPTERGARVLDASGKLVTPGLVDLHSHVYPYGRRSASRRKVGTLQVGAPGDVSVLELVEGPVSFLDTRNNTRSGQAHLRPVHTVVAGVPFGRPYNSPFAVR